MNVRIIQERLDSYRSRSRQEEENALREITQELVLAAIARAGFFKKAAFQGGTCLRIFYSLERFSEDLDFILKKPDRGFSLQPFWKPLRTLIAWKFTEPRTPEAPVTAVCDAPLRRLTTVDSQHSASDTPGSDGEKSVGTWNSAVQWQIPE